MWCRPGALAVPAEQQKNGSGPAPPIPSNPSTCRALPAARVAGQLVEADASEEAREIGSIRIGVVDHAFDPAEPKPGGRTGDEPRADPEAPVVLAHVQVPDVGPAGIARAHAAGRQIGGDLDQADLAAVEHGREARAADADLAPREQAGERCRTGRRELRDCGHEDRLDVAAVLDPARS